MIINKYKAVFLCYSPFHLYIAFQVSRELSLGKASVVIDTSLSNITNLYDHIFDVIDKVPIPSFSSSIKAKILASINIFFTKKHEAVDLYIPNDAHTFIMLYLKKWNYSYLHYIDEGNTYVSLLRRKLSLNQESSFLSTVFSKLFSTDQSGFLLDRKFTSAWVQNSHLVSSLKPNRVFHEIPTFTVPVPDFFEPSSNLKCNTLVISSPLSENGFCLPQEEILILTRFLDKYKYELGDIKIKSHYRENANKYKHILKDQVSMLDLPSAYPLQFIIHQISPQYIVAFHSGCIFQVPSFIKVISLSDQLSSAECLALSLGIKQASKYISNIHLSKALPPSLIC